MLFTVGKRVYAACVVQCTVSVVMFRTTLLVMLDQCIPLVMPSCIMWQCVHHAYTTVVFGVLICGCMPRP